MSRPASRPRPRDTSVPGRIAPAPLAIRLLGRVELRVDDREVRLPTRGPQSLLAILALKPRVRTREAVASEIWPDGEGSGVSASLRQALWLLRSAFTAAGLALESYLDIDAEVVGFRPSVVLDLDVASFEGLLDGRPSRPEEALELYRGDLAECLALECLAFERERLSDRFEDALALVAERRMLENDAFAVREAALRLLARDPLREEAHAALLWVHGQTGTRHQVLRQYRRLTEMLAGELDVEPLPETDVVYREALAATVERSRARAAVAAFKVVPASRRAIAGRTVALLRDPGAASS